MITLGTSLTQEKLIRHNDSAAALGSGTLEVLATPAMIAFMENTAYKCIQNMLEEDTTTVGVEINAKHIKASRIGDAISCKATVVEVEGKRIRFEIEAHDSTALIGTATHDRFIVNEEKFMNKIHNS